jgi:hypothetical protein
MPSLAPFPLDNFESYCDSLARVGIDPGYVLYTNRHASDNKPAARLISTAQLAAARAHISSPSDDTFVELVKAGVFFDTEWDRNTTTWQLIAFEGWETLHKAFQHLHFKAGSAFTELTGLSDFY